MEAKEQTSLASNAVNISNGLAEHLCLTETLTSRPDFAIHPNFATLKCRIDRCIERLFDRLLYFCKLGV